MIKKNRYSDPEEDSKLACTAYRLDKVADTLRDGRKSRDLPQDEGDYVRK